MKKWIFLLIVIAPFAMSWGTESASVAEAVTAVVAPQAAPLAEDQIPLKIDENKKALQSAASSERILLTFVVVAGLLAVAYVFVRRYKTSNNINKSNKQIKVISQHYLGPKKSLAIIHVAGESILIGVTDSNISMIKSLSLIDDEIPQNMPNKFSDSMTTEGLEPAAGATVAGSIQYATTTTTAAASNQVAALATSEDEEDFSFSKIKDNVSKKLKNIRG